MPYDEGIRIYYKRKAAEGKDKMSILNAVRNKLVLRIAAVIKRKQRVRENENSSLEKTLELICFNPRNHLDLAGTHPFLDFFFFVIAACIFFFSVSPPL